MGQQEGWREEGRGERGRRGHLSGKMHDR